MVTNQINFEELEQKTSKEFVRKILISVDQVNESDVFTDKEIRFCIEENDYTLIVLMSFSGVISKYEYRFSTKDIDHNLIGWNDIRNFFDIPFVMKKIKKTS